MGIRYCLNVGDLLVNEIDKSFYFCGIDILVRGERL